MLYILFSPSEGKKFYHTSTQLKLTGGIALRQEIVHNYNNIIKEGDINTLKNLFGLKKEEEVYKYAQDIFTAPTAKAIERYDGVAYDYLDYNSLSEDAQTYLHSHLLIFSNLFGVVRADDEIPIYKVKQGNAIGDIKPELYYKKQLKDFLDNYLHNTQILDLRAGYYDKFYQIPQPYTTLKFLKNGKVVSHWAKAYRGIVLRACAQANISSLEEFHKLEIEYLQVEDIKKIKNKTQITFSILE